MNLNVMMHAMAEGTLKGMYVMGEDIVISEANSTRLEEGLNHCEFLVLQDIFPNETFRYAHVVFPATCFAEKDGVFTNSDRRVQRVRKAVEPPGQARADWQILCEMARASGYPMPNYQHPKEIYAEMAALCDKFAGISHERIDREGGLQWPCPHPTHPGTPTLHEEAPLRGKALFVPVHYRPSQEQADNAYPFVLSTGRTLYHYNAATQTRRDAGPNARQPVAFVEMHPRDARKLGLESGQQVKVTSRRGELRCKLEVTRKVRPGCVWMPFHFAEAKTNHLTNDAGDSITGTAEYKVCAVRVEADGVGAKCAAQHS
jgi:predicted molibdopterin-dependent oxidoreductase YjgC